MCQWTLERQHHQHHHLDTLSYDAPLKAIKCNVKVTIEAQAKNKQTNKRQKLGQQCTR